jgi:hypothetical protein
MNHDRIQRALSECVKLLQDPERARAAASLLRYNNSEELKEDLNSLRNNLDNVLFSLDLDSLELPEPDLDIDFDTDFELPELIL